MTTARVGAGTGTGAGAAGGRSTELLYFVFLLSFVSLTFFSACSLPMPDWGKHREPHVGTTIVVIGDTQRTSSVERLFCNREQNDSARIALVRKIAEEEDPAFVVHLGDMVAAGGDPDDWKYFDRLMSPLTFHGVRIAPVLGNHEHWGNAKISVREVSRRFPELAHGTFYSMRYRGVGLLWLDSNLSGDAALEQARWFEERLESYQRDPGIRAVLAFTHHPPFTNGNHRHGDTFVRDALVPCFERYSKAVVFMSGHVHGYERFVLNGKTYVVTGGGGGPRVDYRIGRDADLVPAYPPRDYPADPAAARAFNYVVLTIASAKLVFTTKCVDTKSDTPRTLPDTVPPHPSTTPHAPASHQEGPDAPYCNGGVLDTFEVPFP